MMCLVHSNEFKSWRCATLFWSALLVHCAVVAQTDATITQVFLTVRQGQSNRPTAGLLYRVFADRREYVADIGADGKLSVPVKCTATDNFEAQSESKLDLASTPARRPCGQPLAFAFTRIWTVAYPADYQNPLANSGAAPKVFLTYSTVLEQAGNPIGARPWKDAAVMAMANNLGDTKFDELVFRDASKGFELSFNSKGVAALKSKQIQFGIPPTGELDKATQDAVAKYSGWTADVDALRCSKSKKNLQYTCEPTALSVEAGPPVPAVVILPKVAF